MKELEEKRGGLAMEAKNVPTEQKNQDSDKDDLLETVRIGLEHFNIGEVNDLFTFENKERLLEHSGLKQMMELFNVNTEKGKTRIIIDYDPEFPLIFLRTISQ